MSVDKDTVRRIAKLARLAVPEARLEPMAAELNGIFQWVEMLGEVDVTGVPAMTSVVAQKLKWREDKVSDGNQSEHATCNAGRFHCRNSLPSRSTSRSGWVLAIPRCTLPSQSVMLPWIGQRNMTRCGSVSVPLAARNS